MRASTAQPTILRLETGLRCEVKDCREMALWLITTNGRSVHLCGRHTRSSMRDTRKWGKAPGAIEVGA